MMTRKHYIKFANAINNCTNGITCIDKRELIDELIVIFKQDNSSFSSQRFINAIENKKDYVHNLSGTQLKKIKTIMNERNN